MWRVDVRNSKMDPREIGGGRGGWGRDAKTGQTDSLWSGVSHHTVFGPLILVASWSTPVLLPELGSSIGVKWLV